MYLKSEGLYKTKQGKRYRVTYDPVDDCFTCSSFGGTWSLTGYATCKVGMDGKRKKPHLVCEVVEKRWISVPKDSAGEVYQSFDPRHYQMLVSREDARSIALDGNEKADNKKHLMPKEKTPNFTSDYGTVETIDEDGFKVSFDWSFSKDIKTYLTIETSNGVEISIPL